jgi:uncharacterized membrane protein SirB2
MIATRRKKWHMMMGRVGVLLAVGIVIAGVRVGIEAARFNPPELRLFGLVPKQFMAVPVIGILTFAVFVTVGVIYRLRPDVHRPMMLLASLTIVSAALGRIPILNFWYEGTWLEYLFTANLITVILGAMFLAGKCMSSRSFDRQFAKGYAVVVVVSLAISFIARTSIWDVIATFLLRQ